MAASVWVGRDRSELVGKGLASASTEAQGASEAHSGEFGSLEDLEVICSTLQGLPVYGTRGWMGKLGKPKDPGLVVSAVGSSQWF